MKLSQRGCRFTLFVTALAAPLVLAACASPLTQPEAETIAARRVARFCGQTCGTWRVTGAERLHGRWLVDFDTPSRKLGVLVDDGGSTQVTVWDK